MKELPIDLWLEVLMCLDYIDLRKCERVSKTLKAFVQHAAFDATLFRSKTVITNDADISIEDVQLHPAFERLSFECATDIDRVWLYEDNRLTDFCAATEHATSPAVNRLRLQIHEWPVINVQNKYGVTVLQVMKALCRFFAKGCYRDAMGDHTGWTGFNETVLDSSGRLRLRAMWFDS